MKKQLITATITSLVALATASAQGEAPQGQPSQEELQRMIAEAMKNQPAPAAPKPTMTKEEALAFFSENAGINLGSQVKSDKVIDKELFLKGLKAALSGEVKADDIDPEKMREAQGVFETAQIDLLKSEGVDFLTANKAKEGVKVTASGLQYKVIAEGEGYSAKAGDTVSVHYTGKLVDGTVFDTSSKRGEPIKFPLGQGRVIPGWDEGIALMKPGAKYELYIPQELGYGERGSGGIPPFAALHFEVELVSIEKPAAPEPKEAAPAKKMEDVKEAIPKEAPAKKMEDVKEAIPKEIPASKVDEVKKAILEEVPAEVK